MVQASMAGEKPSSDELGRRLAAGRAYRRLHQIPAAKRLGLHDTTLGRYEEGEIPEHRISDLIDRAPRAFELPEAFFTIDFNELTQMADAWDHVKRLARPRDLERLVDQALDEDSQSE